jgi:hypothetical protein
MELRAKEATQANHRDFMGHLIGQFFSLNAPIKQWAGRENWTGSTRR